VRAAAASRKVGRSCGTINVTPSAGQPGAFAAPRNPKLTCDGATREAPRKKRDGSRIDGRRPHDVSGPLSASQTFSIATSPAGLCQWIGRMSPYRRLRRQMPPATRPRILTVVAPLLAWCVAAPRSNAKKAVCRTTTGASDVCNWVSNVCAPTFTWVAARV